MEMKNALRVDTFQEWPNIIKEHCTALIKQVKTMESIPDDKPYEIDSSIEIGAVLGDPQRWEISLRRDLIEWYENCSERSYKYRQSALNYVEPILEVYKRNGSKQSNPPKNNEDFEKLYRCKETIYTNACKCNFYVCKDYCIMKTKKYYVAARSNRVRVITMSPWNHVNNETWIQDEQTWVFVRDVIMYIKVRLGLDEFPIEGIFVNFGRWQTQTATGERPPSSGHAHINIVLTEKTIQACKM